LKRLQEVADPPQYGFTASASATGNARILRITDIQDVGVDCPRFRIVIVPRPPLREISPF
jgi:hypothetical protein